MGYFLGGNCKAMQWNTFFLNYRLESRFLLGLLFVVQTVQSSYFVGRFLKWNLGDPETLLWRGLGMRHCVRIRSLFQIRQGGERPGDPVCLHILVLWEEKKKGLSSAIYCTSLKRSSRATIGSSKMDMQKIEKKYIPFAYSFTFPHSESGASHDGRCYRCAWRIPRFWGKKNWIGSYQPFRKKVSDSWHSRFKRLFQPPDGWNQKMQTSEVAKIECFLVLLQMVDCQVKPLPNSGQTARTRPGRVFLIVGYAGRDVLWDTPVVLLNRQLRTGGDAITPGCEEGGDIKRCWCGLWGDLFATSWIFYI